jgi:hypothetical protein
MLAPTLPPARIGGIATKVGTCLPAFSIRQARQTIELGNEH